MESGRIVGFNVLPPLIQLNHLPIQCKLKVMVEKSNISQRKLQRLQHMKIPSAKPANAADALLAELIGPCLTSAKMDRIDVNVTVPESRSSASLRRQMITLADSPGFRSLPLMLTAYKALAKQRLKIQKTAQNAAQENRRNKLLNCQGKREYWDYICAVCSVKGGLKIDTLEAEQHFRKLLCTEASEEPIPGEFVYSAEDADPELNNPIDPDEVWRALKKMKNLADGEDRISVKAIRHLDCDEIALFFHEVSVSEDLPQSWKRSILVPIPKPGLKGWRGLSVQTLIRRLYSRCLVPRIGRWMERKGVVPQTQSGFCKGF